MCVNFTYLNKTCLNDSYPFPKINHLVDSTAGFKYLSFFNANFGYYQILMHLDDKKKTTLYLKGEIFIIKQCHSGLRMLELLINEWLIKDSRINLKGL